MDLLISIIVYFNPDTDLVISNSNNTIFMGKVKDFNILKIERGDISFAESFYILSMIPDKNKITFLFMKNSRNQIGSYYNFNDIL